MCNCLTTYRQLPTVHERLVAVAVVQDILAAFHCQLDAVDNSVEVVDPREV